MATGPAREKVRNSRLLSEQDAILALNLSCFRRERERESDGTGFLFEEPNPTGSRPSDLIGLYKRWHQEERPQPAKRSHGEEGGGRQGLHCGVFIEEGNRAPVSM